MLFITTADGTEDGKQEFPARPPWELPPGPPRNDKHEPALFLSAASRLHTTREASTGPDLVLGESAASPDPSGFAQPEEPVSKMPRTVEPKRSRGLH